MTTNALFIIAAIAVAAFGVIVASLPREHPEELGDEWEDYQ